MIISLTRYLLRMSTRCTPFGLFAGCTLGAWGEQHDVRLALPGQFIRHTRPDMDYLCQLAQSLAQLPGIKEFLRYQPNSSLLHNRTKYSFRRLLLSSENTFSSPRRCRVFGIYQTSFRTCHRRRFSGRSGRSPYR
ncbi:MAG: lantibiotic dehydratase [Lewinellaceae bacterium]|nr:lantibiotic dehydratase [Lewinellaceae bacterium]